MLGQTKVVLGQMPKLDKLMFFFDSNPLIVEKAKP